MIINSFNNLPLTVEIGATFKDDPITTSKSHCNLSFWNVSLNIVGSFSPKNAIDGFIIPFNFFGHFLQYGTVC